MRVCHEQAHVLCIGQQQRNVLALHGFKGCAVRHKRELRENALEHGVAHHALAEFISLNHARNGSHALCNKRFAYPQQDVIRTCAASKGVAVGYGDGNLQHTWARRHITFDFVVDKRKLRISVGIAYYEIVRHVGNSWIAQIGKLGEGGQVKPEQWFPTCRREAIAINGKGYLWCIHAFS